MLREKEFVYQVVFLCVWGRLGVLDFTTLTYIEIITLRERKAYTPHKEGKRISENSFHFLTNIWDLIITPIRGKR